MNLESLITTLEQHRLDGGPTANVLVSCLSKRSAVWKNWDPQEALTTIYLFIHDDTEPDTVTQEQHNALEEINKVAGAFALRILTTAIRRIK